jgi:hypothetical protein
LQAGGEQFPLPLGDDFDGAVDHFDGGLVVDGVRLARDVGGPPFGCGQGVCWQVRIFDVWEDREVDDPQRLIAGGGRLPLDEC